MRPRPRRHLEEWASLLDEDVPEDALDESDPSEPRFDRSDGRRSG